MKTVSAQRSEEQQASPYAVAADFCRIFEKELNRLYLLSLLLTADHQLAEECFARGLADSTSSNRVFKEWAGTWARRTIIQNAIQMVQPHPGHTDEPAFDPDGSGPHALTERSEIAAVLALPAFERFAFVLSVLERYSDQDCSLLLGCVRSDVTSARVRALQGMRRSTELPSIGLGIASGRRTQAEDSGSASQTQVAAQAVAFA
jgi:DNA-directed RNA polymerase specialized sigma24 family protein